MITELSICWGHHQRHFLIIFNRIENFRKNTFLLGLFMQAKSADIT